MMAHTPEDASLLVAEYTLGLLSDEETAAVQALLGRDAHAVADALKWEEALLELTDRLPPVALRSGLWAEISSALDFDDIPDTSNQPAPLLVASPQPLPLRPEHTAAQSAAPVLDQPPVQRRTRVRLRALMLIALVLLVAGVGAALIPRTPTPPPITVIQVAPTQGAILQAPGDSSTPGWIVTVGPQGDVLLKPMVRTDIPADASVQLWTYNKSLPAPRSLGLIDPNQAVTVPANLMGEIGEGQFFEMTQEAQGGSASTGPEGAILFIGRVVTFAEAEPMAISTPPH